MILIQLNKWALFILHAVSCLHHQSLIEICASVKILVLAKYLFYQNKSMSSRYWVLNNFLNSDYSDPSHGSESAWNIQLLMMRGAENYFLSHFWYSKQIRKSRVKSSMLNPFFLQTFSFRFGKCSQNFRFPRNFSLKKAFLSFLSFSLFLSFLDILYMTCAKY